MTAYCKENQLNPNYFSTRRQQLLGCSKKEAAEAFVKALPPQVSTVQQGEVHLTVGAASLQFTGVAPEFIAAIVKHLA